ncbi:MAG: histidinol dehydrogenase [Firmicutes bacterium]|jgi:histidinol dehydrogenase|nr:histidinol dehydrogenase [Bacillota bacterium]
MRIFRTWELGEEKVRELLTRPFIDEVEVTAAFQERTKAVWGEALSPQEVVARILNQVKTRGNDAVIEYAAKLDGAELTAESLWVSDAEWEEALSQVSGDLKEALRNACSNIERYHARQKPKSWITVEPDGSILGQKVTPLDRVGIYVPGGSAPLVSTVLMCAIPARVAGVGEVVMASPVGKSGMMNPHILAAAHLAGVDRVLKVGGAQAIAALAYGTRTIPVVDKIVGPGNIFVTLAKQMVYGRVGIESLAGPSEILVLADETANPRYLAADLLSQAEHDPEAAAILLTDSSSLAEEVQREIAAQLQDLGRKAIAELSLAKNGVILVCRDMKEAACWANSCAPEHLELCVADPFGMLHLIRHAGAIFLGAIGCEPIGDYIAGPNHVLPTNGTARFSSPLGTEDFLKHSSIISYTKEGLARFGPDAIRLAEVEGLGAHANAIRIRLETLADK